MGELEMMSPGCRLGATCRAFANDLGWVSLVVEYSLIVGTENSLAGALARGSGARPRNPGLSHFADHARRRDSDGGGDSGPAGRTHDDFGPSPPGPVCHGDCATYGA